MANSTKNKPCIVGCVTPDHRKIIFTQVNYYPIPNHTLNSLNKNYPSYKCAIEFLTGSSNPIYVCELDNSITIGTWVEFIDPKLNHFLFLLEKWQYNKPV